MHLHFFTEWPLPTPYASAIQSINTAHALASGGSRVTLCTGPHHAPVEELLADYDLPPTPLLDLVPVFNDTSSDVHRAVHLLRALDERADHTRHTIVTRGRAGLRVFQAIRAIGPHQARRAVFEAHRLESIEVRWPWDRWRINRREGQAVRAADGVVAVTDAVSRALQAAYDYHAPTLILPGGTAWAPALPPRRDTYQTDIVYAGKLMQRKGLGLLLNAMRFLPDRTLTVVGGTPSDVEDWRGRANGLGVAAQITFTGYVAPSEVPELMLRARVGVCPLPADGNIIAEQYTSPLKVKQMMALGVPIVGTDVPSLRALLAHERTSLLVPPNDPALLASAITRLLDDDAFAERLRIAAHIEAERYRWEARAARLLAFAEELHEHSRVASLAS